jgi:hypothetical protein
MNKTFRITSEWLRGHAIQFILDLNLPMIVTVHDDARSLRQNAFLHEIIGNVAAQKEWDGSKQSAQEWKQLLTASWMKATGRNIKILPALDHLGFIPIYQKTSVLNKDDCSELIEYILAWGSQNGVKFTIDTRGPDVWQQTSSI